MAHRVNVMLDDEIWNDVQKMPKGERSRLINRAIRDYLLHQQRHEAMRRMDELRARTKAVAGSTEEWVREDRDSHW